MKDAVALLCEVHGRALRLLSARRQQHFQGLQQASRRAQLSAAAKKKLCALDNAWNIVRHITEASCNDFLPCLGTELAAHGCEPTCSVETKEDGDAEGTISELGTLGTHHNDIGKEFRDDGSDHDVHWAKVSCIPPAMWRQMQPQRFLWAVGSGSCVDEAPPSPATMPDDTLQVAAETNRPSACDLSDHVAGVEAPEAEIPAGIADLEHHRVKGSEDDEEEKKEEEEYEKTRRTLLIGSI